MLGLREIELPSFDFPGAWFALGDRQLHLIVHTAPRSLRGTTEDPTGFTFTEEWTDPASLDAHFGTAHIRGALERFPELLAEELDLRRYALVG